MADSTVLDVSKLKVIELRKELKTRGLSHTGAKDELVARLQAAISQDDHGDINLDSDEIDSDGVLDDEDDKSQTDILDDNAADTLNEELALAEPPKPAPEEAKLAHKPAFKRKLTTESSTKPDEKGDKEPTAKKIVLNRATSITTPAKPDEEPEKEKTESKPASTTESGKVKITADVDSKTRLELRASRFGLPTKMSDTERKEARMKRFGQNTGDTASNDVSKPAATTDSNQVETSDMKAKLELRAKRFGLPVQMSDNEKKEARMKRFNQSTGDITSCSEQLEKLKKRADRFGLSVSKVMIDIEKQDKLEKRKAKFGAA